MGYSATLGLANSVLRENKVLRNVFILLALSLLPTIGGVYLGMAIGLPAFMASSPWIFLGIFLVGMFLLFMVIEATKNQAFVFLPVTAMTLIMGAVLSGIVSATLKSSHGANTIALAFAGTVLSLAVCSIYAMTTKRDFSGWGGGLFGVLIGIIGLGLLNMFFQVPLLGLLIACAGLVLFTFFLIYDVQQIVNGGETNYITAFVQVYLDLINIFANLLQILGVFGSDD